MKQFTYKSYFRNNKKKALLTIISVSLAVSCIIFIGSLFRNVNDTAAQLRGIYKNSIDIIRTKGENISQDTLKEDKHIKDMVKMKINYLYLNTLLGTDLQSNVYYMEQEDIKLILEKENYLITSGKMPDSSEEILLSEEMAKYYNLKVGDTLNGESINYVYKLGNSYKVSGLVKSGYVSFIPILKGDLADNNNSYVSYKLLFDAKDRDVISKDIEKYKTKNIDIKTYESEGKNIEDTMLGFNIGFTVINVILVINLTLSLSFFSYIKYNGRLSEFGTLKAIGFSRNKLLAMVAKEITINLVIAFILGIIIAISIELGLNVVVINGKGLPSLVVGIIDISRALIMPISIAITSILAISKLLRSADIVSLIEGKI